MRFLIIQMYYSLNLDKKQLSYLYNRVNLIICNANKQYYSLIIDKNTK